jgi:hypothetical protein
MKICDLGPATLHVGQVYELRVARLTNWRTGGLRVAGHELQVKIDK